MTITIAAAFQATPQTALPARHVNMIAQKSIRRAESSASSLGASLQTPSETSTETMISSSSPPTHHQATQATNMPSIPSHSLSIDEMNAIFKFEKNGKTKVLNATGLYHLAVILLTMPFWLASMETLAYLTKTLTGNGGFRDAHRAKFDYSGKLWCRSYLSLTNCYPEIAGDVSRLEVESDSGACLFVANHASFLDIAVLCCVLDPVFKFIAKDSLAKFPGVGRQLVGGEHVLIDRTNKRSQLRTFKQAITYLKNGVPIMAFPEGARSPDGRLMDFKGGIFSMAVKANVPIVPLSLANTHAVMPTAGFLPVQSGEGKLRVFVHDPISVEGKSEEEISREVREALLSELPLDQHPLVVEEEEEEDVSVVV
eukprot:CAMPEP_0172301598 /NCGR_PEP_ID=MMETSP1058-20130122/3446_1 /TAXON_ID=83371 /ORGANISM="Detonula confervacea, Strain CCMP 353" /LENGTH=368 /DNA_ID=CAMNT_0013011769 /DNA_START=182 /DNA_END=1288 /DNA_ORIENTATION=-